MKSKSFMLMILSMGFGLIAAIGISQVMGRNNAPVVQAPKMGPVLVAADHIDHNALLTEENVKIENWPLEIIPETAVTDIEEIDDMAITTRLSKGSPIMMPDLAHKNDLGRLSIPDGYKVVAIKVSEDDTIAGLLNPGDKVDVIGLFKTADRDGTMRTFSKTFLKALRVFSVNAQMRATAGNRTETSTRGSAIVGVLVTERQSEAIVYVQKTGQLKLVLRGDHVEGDDDDMNDLLSFRGRKTKPTKSRPESEENNSFQTTFGSVSNPAQDANTMVVWNGPTAERYKFQRGSLPQSTERNAPSKPAPDMLNLEKDNDQDESDSFDESDRGLEEDQYPAQ